MKNAAKNVDAHSEGYNYFVPILLTKNAALQDEVSTLTDKLSDAEKVISNAEKIINILQEKIRLSQVRQFGRKSEQIGKQLEMVFDEVEIKPEEPEEEPATETITYNRQKKTNGRNIDTSILPREQVIHDLTDKRCETCGSELKKMGEDKSEQLEYIPAQLKVIEHITPKYTCRCCETIKTADKAESPLPKSMAGASLITDVIIKKYEYHLPWYRQSKIFAQEGIDIPANTISNWFMQSGEVLEPLKKALWRQLDNVNVLQADETTVKILDENIKGYMWCYHSCVPHNRFVLFEYNDSRSSKVVNDTLADYQGILQTDGYYGYNGMRTKGEVINLGCFAHCRRKFIEVTKVVAKTGMAHEIVSLIGKLYKIEERAREEKLTFAARKELRQKEAKTLLDKIHLRLIKAQPPPQSVLSRAITYALNQWDYLIRYIDYGEAEIDNNWCENQIRPFALGRKNWLFIGNKRAADTAAFFYSLIQTCKLNSVDVRGYLTYVLNKVGPMRRGEIDPVKLLPQLIDKNLLA